MADKQKSVVDRRNFLGALASGVGSTAVVGAFSTLAQRIQAAESPRLDSARLLHEAIDQTTGLPLLKLPEGFRYASFGWTNEPLADGRPTPADHDGMAVIRESGDEITLCRNHEIDTSLRDATQDANAYDPHAVGGCSTLTFDRKTGVFKSAKMTLTGTVKNCAGGATPWGSWLSCEETVVDPSSQLDEGAVNYFTRPHGFVFEVPAEGLAEAKPIESLGRFVHEAVAIDPESGIIYLTEDRDTAGLYRMVPAEPGNLHAGGRFQMLAAKKTKDCRKGMQARQSFDTHWVDIEDRLRAHTPGTQDEQGVYTQGKQAGGLTFARLEGCDFFEGKLFVTATSGGNSQAGQVWEYDPREERLTLLFESPGEEVLDMPDNMAVSPRGGIVLCEDGHYVPQRVQLLKPNGQLFPLAANNLKLDGLHGHQGDFRDSEWAGATFSKDGEWLFVNIQTPGVTFAITGPWEDLLA